MVINYHVLVNNEPSWSDVAKDIAEKDWEAAKYLSKQMLEGRMTGWESVIVAYEKEHLVGFCSIVKEDITEGLSYTPYIATVYVDPNYRGEKNSDVLIKKGEYQLKKIGFKNVFILSQLENFYEKKGYEKIDSAPDIFGRELTIFQKSLNIGLL